MKVKLGLIAVALAATLWGCQESVAPVAPRELGGAGKGGGKGGGGGSAIAVTVLVSSLEGESGFIASGINDAGEVVGHHARVPMRVGFHWEAGTALSLGPVAPSDIASTGRIAGTTAADGAAVWDPAGGSAWTREVLPGGSYTQAWSASDDGTLVAGTLDGVPAIWSHDGVAWTLTVLDSPGFGTAQDVNDDSLVVGGVGPMGEERAAVWTGPGSSSQSLPALAGDRASLALAVNRDGDVVGRAWDADGVLKAVLWKRAGGGWAAPIVVSDPRWVKPWDGAEAVDVSDTGWIVVNRRSGGGAYAFAWNPATGKRTALPGSGPGGKATAFAINESGQVVGESGGAAVMWTLP